MLWEAGVVIELPPWVFLAYPSSLLYHFNIDIDGTFSPRLSLNFSLTYPSDIEFVSTAAGVRPTRENSTHLQEGDKKGRGSFVFFNEATMYQSSETGHSTLEEAKEAGHSGITSFPDDAQAAFSSRANYFRIQGSPTG